MKIFLSALLFIPISLFSEVIRLDGVDFHYRIPQKFNEKSKIMVLFGGRNWQGERTLKTYNFNALADKHRIFLLSPSFKDRDYWEPQVWSGRLLQKAIRQLEKRYKLQPQKVYFYGYSAGGQCTVLFYQWMPQKVAACGIHACGVYPEKIKYSQAPFLITCGTEDKERFQISRYFIYRYRNTADCSCGNIFRTPDTNYQKRLWNWQRYGLMICFPVRKSLLTERMIPGK